MIKPFGLNRPGLKLVLLHHPGKPRHVTALAGRWQPLIRASGTFASVQAQLNYLTFGKCQAPIPYFRKMKPYFRKMSGPDTLLSENVIAPELPNEKWGRMTPTHQPKSGSRRSTKRSFSGRSDQRLRRPLSACFAVQPLRTTGLMVNQGRHQGKTPRQNPKLALPLPAQISYLQGQNRAMRLDQLRLLFEASNLMAAEVVTAPLESGPALELPVQTT